MPGSSESLLVACLCAEWCGSCRDYRTTFEALAARFVGQVRFVWLDVEDEADALGDPQVDDFPTLLIARDDAALFYGAVTPQAQTAERMVRGALGGDLAAIEDPEVAALVARVRRASAAA